MPTTTVVRNSIELSYPDLNHAETMIAMDAHKRHISSVLTEFKTAHGVTTNNLVSQLANDQTSSFVRSWPDLETAQAWVDVVLSGTLTEGLDHPTVIVSAQVDPE